MGYDALNAASILQELAAGDVVGAGLTLAFRIADSVDPHSALRRILDHEPAPIVLGSVEVFGLSFFCEKDVFIPRSATEPVILRCIEILNSAERASTVLDVGTGCGLIAISLAKALQNGRFHGIDIDPKAIAVARQNAAKMGVEVNFRVADLNDADAVSLSQASVDLLVANPPYIPERVRLTEMMTRHQPRASLVSGPDGMDAIRGCFALADRIVAGGGAVIVEHDPSQEGIVALVARDYQRFCKVLVPESHGYSEFKRDGSQA